MQLSLIRRGGFAGLRPPAFVVDLTALPPAAAQEFQRLVGAARSDLPQVAVSRSAQPDRFTYVLRIAEPGHTTEHEFDELAATPPIMALVAAIQATARNKGGVS
jgi:hypothetical protein